MAEPITFTVSDIDKPQAQTRQSPVIPTPVANGTAEDAQRFVNSLPGTATPSQRAVAVSVNQAPISFNVSDIDQPQAQSEADAGTAQGNSQSVGSQPWSAKGVLQTLGTKEGLEAVAEGATDPLVGFGKSLLQVAHSAGRVVNAATGDHLSSILPTSFDVPPSLQMADTAAKGAVGENIGALAETLAEFAYGSGEAEALGAAAKASKYTQIAKLAKIIQDSPPLMKMLSIARTAALSSVQAGAHGQSAVQGAEAEAVGGALGEAASYGIGKLIPKTAPAITEAAETKYYAEQAEKSLNNRLLHVKVARDVEGLAKSAAADVIGIQPISKGTVYSFGDAAGDIRRAAKPTFEKLDEESTGAFQAATNQIADARDVIRKASSTKELEAARKLMAQGQAEMENVFTKSSLSAEDLQTARDSWRKASTLDDLHDKLDRALLINQKALTASAKAGEIPEETVKLSDDQLMSFMNPARFVKSVKDAVNEIPANRLAEVIGEDGKGKLMRMSDEFSQAMSSERSQRALAAVLRAAAAKAPKGSSLNTLGYGFISGLGGAALGAAGGAGLASATGDNPTAGAVKGAMVGGALLSSGVTIWHFFVTHPDLGIQLLKAANKMAPYAEPAKTAIAPNVTHTFDSVNGLQPVPNP
jgi:hypothetical protein